MRQKMNSRTTAAHAEATAAQAHTASAPTRAFPLPRWVRKHGYGCACTCTWECGGSCGYGRVRCAAPISLQTPTPSERSAAAALSLAVDPRLKAQQHFPPTQNLSGLRTVRFLRAHTRKTPAGIPQRHACHSSVSAQATTPPWPERCMQRPPHARCRARWRDKRRHSRPPRFAHTWHCRRRRGRVPARPHSTVHRS